MIKTIHLSGLSRAVIGMAVLTIFILTNCNKNEHSSKSMVSDSTVPPGARLSKVGIVIHKGDPKAWDGGMVESPSVWYDSVSQRYGLVYAGYALTSPNKTGYESVSNPHIGLAWSNDLVHWTKSPDNPLFGPSGKEGTPDETGTSGPLMWYENGTWYLFYFGLTESGYEKGNKTLNVALSTDMKHWKRYSGNPIIRPEGNGWRAYAIWHPNIVKNGDTYYLFFNASGVVEGANEERIGYATSKDLLHWKVDDKNSPIVSGSGEKGKWDARGRAGDPSVYKIGDTWYMAYYSWDGKNSRDGLAMTDTKHFPLGWKTYKGNPVLDIGSPGSFDALHAGKPFIYITPERYFHFYTAVDTSQKREIALAVWPLLR